MFKNNSVLLVNNVYARLYVNPDGQFIASFFVDPYARPGQKTSGDWMLCGRGQWTFMYLLLYITTLFLKRLQNIILS